MKTCKLFIIIFLISNITCYHVPPRPKFHITYPDTGAYGKNLLAEKTTEAIIEPETTYSLAFILVGDLPVRMVLNNNIAWDYTRIPPPIGWTNDTINISTGTGLFTTQIAGLYDIGIRFAPIIADTSSIDIYIYNDNAPTRTIIIRTKE